MRHNNKKQKSFLYNFSVAGTVLLLLGGIFSSVALVLQFIPISPESVTVSVNGVPQPPTAETLGNFRLIFLLTFGGVGAILMIIGGIFYSRNKRARKNEKWLKNNGVRLIGEVTGLEYSNVRINGHSTQYLLCSYRELEGRTYVFKSRILRINPVPYLDEDKIIIYHEKGNIKNYFVDVDGSINGLVFEI